MIAPLTPLEYLRLNQASSFFRAGCICALEPGTVYPEKPVSWDMQDWVMYQLGVSETKRIFGESEA